MKTIVIIQARMGSTRLPGKVLMKINGQSILESLINQINFCNFIDKKIIATTTKTEDDVIYEICIKNNWNVFRGQSSDVLDRFYNCAKQYSADIIVRLTADNPLIDPSLVDDLIKIFNDNGYDYVSNCESRTFPYGTEVEVFSFNTLERAWKNTMDSYDREHVTPYMRNQKIFKTFCLESKENFSNLRWTVDTIDDLNFVRKLYTKCDSKPILTTNLIKIINPKEI